MKNGNVIRISFLFFLAVISAVLEEKILENAGIAVLLGAREESDTFRQMQMSAFALEQLVSMEEQTQLSPGDLLTLFYPETGGVFLHFPHLQERETYLERKIFLLKRHRAAYERLAQSYEAIWNDVACFPVADDAGCVYENSWMFERNYGGKRGHEGTDLMPEENLAGYYQIYSMTDGVVEKMGWLPQGGWRIGIRSPEGGYFYYAHLDSYAKELKPGDTVQAGEPLGYMGDTGYGSEGTRGKFKVHLHLGIYIRTEHTEELSVNPYWVLRYAQLLDREE